MSEKRIDFGPKWARIAHPPPFRQTTHEAPLLNHMGYEANEEQKKTYKTEKENHDRCRGSSTRLHDPESHALPTELTGFVKLMAGLE